MAIPAMNRPAVKAKHSAAVRRRARQRTAAARKPSPGVAAVQARARGDDARKVIAALEAERRRFNNVMDILPVYVILLTPDYHVPFANRFFRERFGESHGKRCFEYLFGRSQPCEVCDTYKVLKTHKPHEWEWTGPDGRQYQIFDFPFADTDGSPLILEMGIDITERKKTAAELEAHRHRLEELVARHTGQWEAANARLQAEVVERKQAEKELTRLASFPERNPNPVVEADLDGRIHYLNPAARQCLPDLEREGPRHPWLAEWQTVVRSVCTGQSPTMTREITVAHRVYHQTIHYAAETRRIRIYGMDITVRQEGERLIRQANERLEMAQRASGAGMWNWDIAAQRMEWSSRLFEMFGLDPRVTDASFEAWKAILHPEDRDQTVARIEQAMQKHVVLNHEYRIRKSDGQARWISVLGQSSCDDQGRPVRMSGLCIDITETKEIEKRNKERDTYYVFAQAALDTIGAMPIGMALIRMSGSVASVNPAFERMTGYAHDEIVRNDARDAIGHIVASGDRAQFLDLLSAAERGKPAASLTVTLNTKTGATVPVIIDLGFIKDPKGAPSSFVVTFKDITMRRKAEEQLRLNEARLSEAQRIAHLGNWDWNVATGELAWSDEIYRIFGVPPQAFGATYDAFLNYVHPADRDKVRAAVDNALRDNRPYSIDHRIVRPDGAERVIHEHGEVFKDQAGCVVRMAGTAQDVTEHKITERRSQMITTLLALFARKSTRSEYLNAVISVLHQESGYRCAGIRIMDDKGKIPYVAGIGFPPRFLESENTLAVDKTSCICSRVITGLLNPRDRSWITPAGSFQCDDVNAVLSQLPPQERERFWGQCMQCGFASMAVVPIRYHDHTYGAVHLADERKGRISREQVDFIESIMAPMIGEAICWFDMDNSLRQASAYHRSLIEASLDPLVTIDAAGKITDVNAATEKITGRSRTELIGTDFADYFTDDEKARSGYQQVFRDGWVQDYALEIRRRDGRVTPVLYNASVYRDEQGKVIGVFAAARDITERKRAERAIADYQDELRALSSRLSLAEESARRRLAVALHDTVGQTQALAQIKLDALGELLTDRKIRQSWTEIQRMVEDAVQQTRTMSFELSPPILYELGLDPALEWLGEEFQRRHGFQVCFDCAGDKSGVDESLRILMFQSARELLTNIVKHARATRVDITSRIADGRITLSVRDNGKGFIAADRLSAAKKNSLGLFSIRERMRYIGGRCEVVSAPGKGAVITLSAPVTLQKKRRARRAPPAQTKMSSTRRKCHDD